MELSAATGRCIRGSHCRHPVPAGGFGLAFDNFSKDQALPTDRAQLLSSAAVPFHFAAGSTSQILNGSRGFFIEVPPDATRLTVRVHPSSGAKDIGLHLRLGVDVALDPDLVADISATQASGDKEIVLVRAGRVALAPGVWFVALTSAASDTPVSGSIEAHIDRFSQ
jgi:hypothetical protein